MKRILVLVLFLFMAFPATLHAQRRLIRVKTILDYRGELKLNDQQVEKIKVYLFDLEKRLRELRVKLASVNREIQTLLREGAKKKGSLDLDKVKQKIKEAYGIRAQMAIAEIETAERINELLTPEQFEKWKKIRLKERMAQRMRR